MEKIKLGNKSFNKIFDVYFLGSLLFLVLVGVYSVYSNNLNAETLDNFNKHLTYVFWGIILMFFISFVPEDKIQILTLPSYFFSIILLIIVLFFADPTYGTKGWIKIGGFSIQPSEFAKLALILTSAFFISIPGVSLNNVRGFGILSIIFLIPIFLIILQPDFGTAIVIIAIFWGFLFWTGFKLNILLTLLGIPLLTLFYLKGIVEFVLVSILFSAILIFANKRNYSKTIIIISISIVFAISSKELIQHLPAHQQKRIHTFIDPAFEPDRASYNLIQSLLAVGSGGFFGKGPFSGTQTQLQYVYAQSSDFVFSIPSEEFGFIGSTLIIIAFFILIRRTIKIGLESISPFLRYSVLGYSVMLIFHFIENVGMTIGLFPVMGIPLPFVSSGGSFFLVNCVLAGLTLNAYRKKFQSI